MKLKLPRISASQREIQTTRHIGSQYLVRQVYLTPSGLSVLLAELDFVPAIVLYHTPIV
jgi:hypothetical protein